MDQLQTLERLLSLEEVNDNKDQKGKMSDEMVRAIQETQEKIRKAFHNGEPVKARLKKRKS
ncbi:MAG: hypothetical protein P1V13_25840 [Rhizobiaceae bacterium]|nr:hypothetical protein [Rhizobiaceae bacterium]